MNNDVRLLHLIASAPLLLAGCGADDSSPSENDSSGSTTSDDPSTGATLATSETTSNIDPGTTGAQPTEGGDDSDSEGSDSTSSGGSTGTPDECSLQDTPTCVDDTTVLQCQDQGGILVEAELACDEGALCLISGCASEIQQEYIAQITQYVEEVRFETALAIDVDWDQLIVEGTERVVAGDDSPDTLFRAVRALQLQIPQGHQAVSFRPDICGQPDLLGRSLQTFYGACGRVYEDGVIVTVAADDNPLGLEPGDRIVGTDRWPEGPSFLDDVAAEPLCAARTPTTDLGKRDQAADDLFAVIDEGDTLIVIDPQGTQRQVEVPARMADGPIAECYDAFEGAFSEFEAQLTMRPDGVAVIRVPHFGPYETPFPEPFTTESYLQWVSDYIDRLAALMAEIPADAPIVWDARGNLGGSAEVPLAIVAGMPGAIRTQISEGYFRVEGTEPFEYGDANATFSFSVPDDDRLEHDAPTAVLVDAVTASAGDYFALGVKEYSDALLVGTPGTAMYGYGGLPRMSIPGSVIELRHRIDFLQARDMDGDPLEGHVVTPDIAVEYDPSDLANGVDTVLEAAVSALLE